MTQTANLFAGLATGAQEAVSLVLPNLPQMHYLLWGGGRAAIVNPINPLLNAPQIAEILRAAGSRLLITSGPGTELWDRAHQAGKLLPYEVKLLRIGEKRALMPRTSMRCCSAIPLIDSCAVQ